jgi:LPS-assembly lipoprotein
MMGLLQRRQLLLLSLPPVLAACGFRLRGAPDFAFSTILVNGPENSALLNELRQNIAAGGNVRVLPAGTPPDQVQVVLDLLADQREKSVVGLSASGQVREFQLRTRLRFRLRTPQGTELIPETELLQQRDISYTESAALSKEAEEGLLYRDMQSDIVQQLMRRLAAVRTV